MTSFDATFSQSRAVKQGDFDNQVATPTVASQAEVVVSGDTIQVWHGGPRTLFSDYGNPFLTTTSSPRTAATFSVPSGVKRLEVSFEGDMTSSASTAPVLEVVSTWNGTTVTNASATIESTPYSWTNHRAFFGKLIQTTRLGGLSRQVLDLRVGSDTNGSGTSDYQVWAYRTMSSETTEQDATWTMTLATPTSGTAFKLYSLIAVAYDG